MIYLFFSLYCNACETFGDKLGVRAQLLLDGQPISCADGLKKGSYDNLKLAFCLPDIDDVISSQGLSKESFLQLIQGDVSLKVKKAKTGWKFQDGNSVRAMGIFATVYVFDSDVSKQMATQIKIEGVYRRTKYSFFKVNHKLNFSLFKRVFQKCYRTLNFRLKSTGLFHSIKLSKTNKATWHAIRFTETWKLTVNNLWFSNLILLVCK